MSGGSSDNPYQSPATNLQIESSLEPAAIRYQAELARRDISSVTRNSTAIVGLLIALVPFSLWNLLLGLLLILMAHDIAILKGDSSEFLTNYLVGLFVNALILFFLFNCFSSGKKFLRAHPRALLPREGMLTDDSLYLSDADVSKWIPLNALIAYRLKGRTMVLIFDRLGVCTQILSADGFSDPARADHIFSHYAASNKTDLGNGVVDKRLLEKPGAMMLDRVHGDDSVAFDGTLKTDDLRSTPFERLRAKVTIRFVVLVAVMALLAFLFISILRVDSPGMALVIMAPAILVAFFAFMTYLRRLRPLGASGVELACSSGWIDNDSITILTSIDQACVKWDVFEAAGSNDQAIWLKYPGSMNAFVVLADHRFANRSDFDDARKLIDEVFRDR